MTKAIFYMIPVLALAACNSSPTVEASNATAGEVAAKVEASGIRDQLVSPGQWQMTMTINDMTMPGLPPEAAARMKGMMGKGRTFTSCVTPEEAKRPTEKMFAGNDDKNCRYEHFSMGDGKIDMKMRCTGEKMARVMTMHGTYGPTEYQMNVLSQGEGKAGPAGMSMQMDMIGKRIGACTAEQLKDEAKG